jgi:glycopeptide antibiotics resistance protein
MNRDAPANQKPVSPPSGWSNRILLLALAGILFLTLFPFRFGLYAKPPAHFSHFLLGGVWKNSGALDVFLNILLFLPYGFGVSEILRERGWRRRTTFVSAAVAGFLLSYSIEFLQLFTPTRASRWEDVASNTTGAIAGFVIFALCGEVIVSVTAKLENALRYSLTLRRAALLLPLYFAVWFVLSAALQKQTRLTNWDPQAQLLVGNDAVGSSWTAWKGTVSRVQIWNRALPDDLARSVTAGGSPVGSQSGLVTSYDFFSSEPLQDRAKLLPDLSWIPRSPPPAMQNGLVLDGGSWLSTQAPASGLIQALQRTNQFSLEIACTPGGSDEPDGWIVSISRSPELEDLYVHQRDADLEFWFRSPVALGHARMEWRIAGVFAAGQRRDILFSYDGSNLSLYVDGTRHPWVYRLGPGTVLAKSLRRVRPFEIAGYDFIYLALIFIPAGALLGMAVIPLGRREIPATLILSFELVLAPLILEWDLSYVSGRPVYPRYMAISLILVIVGSLWINADRRSAARPSPPSRS